MPTVKISAKIIRWPECCACCCGRADTREDATAVRTEGKRVIRTQAKSWPVPYCRGCQDHRTALTCADYAAGRAGVFLVSGTVLGASPATSTVSTTAALPRPGR